jgi:hypothetical protein
LHKETSTHCIRQYDHHHHDTHLEGTHSSPRAPPLPPVFHHQRKTITAQGLIAKFSKLEKQILTRYLTSDLDRSTQHLRTQRWCKIIFDSIQLGLTQTQAGTIANQIATIE